MNIDWLKESNRWKHLVGVFLVAAITLVFLLTLYCETTWQQFVVTMYVSVAVMFAMEFKDVHHYNGDHVPLRRWDWSAWDWLDIAAGGIGYIAAALVYLIIYVLILIL